MPWEHSPVTLGTATSSFPLYFFTFLSATLIPNTPLEGSMPSWCSRHTMFRDNAHTLGQLPCFPTTCFTNFIYSLLCVCVCAHPSAMVYVWRSEDILSESVLSFPPCRSGGSNSGPQAWSQTALPTGLSPTQQYALYVLSDCHCALSLFRCFGYHVCPI